MITLIVVLLLETKRCKSRVEMDGFMHNWASLQKIKNDLSVPSDRLY